MHADIDSKDGGDPKTRSAIVDACEYVLAKNVRTHLTKIHEDYEALVRAISGK
jgi:hypothetical protein